MAVMELKELLSFAGHSIILMPSDASARQCRDRIARLRGEVADSGQPQKFKLKARWSEQ